MQVSLDKILRPWYLAFAFILLFVVMSVVFFLYRHDSKQQLKDVVAELNYMKDRRAVDKILSENDRYLKVTSFYSEIFAVYGQKYHKKWERRPGEKYEDYIKSKRWAQQGMDRKTMADVGRKMYEWSRLCNIPYFDLIGFGIRESAGNPLARTFHPKDGSILEAGWFQNRERAVDDADDFLDMMPSHMQKVLAFDKNWPQCMYDPMNALKIQVCLVWGNRRIFHNDPSWYVTAVHFSRGTIMKYWKWGIQPPDEFVFNKDKIDEDARNPFSYYYTWNAYVSQFEKFDTQVYIEKGWLELYERKCSKVEWEFINYQREISHLLKIQKTLKLERAEHKELEHKLITKYNEKLMTLDEKFKELNAVIKRGKFTKVKDIYLAGQLEMGKVVKMIRDDKVKGIQKRMLMYTVTVGSVVAVFAIIGLISSVLFIIKVIKYVRRFRAALNSVDEDDKTSDIQRAVDEGLRESIEVRPGQV